MRKQVADLYAFLIDQHKLVAAKHQLDLTNPYDDANAEDLLLAELDLMEVQSVAGFRLKLWQIKQSGKWANVRLPVIDPKTDKQMVDSRTGELVSRSFGDFKSYMEHALAAKEDTSASIIRGAVMDLFEETANGLFINKKTKQPYKVEDLVFLKERNLKVLVDKCRQLKGEGKDVAALGEFIPTAQQGTREDLYDELKSAGLHEGSAVEIQAYRVFDGDGDGAVIQMHVSSMELKLLTSALGRRLKLVDATPDELIAVLKGDVSDDDDVRAADEPDAFTEWLQNQAASQA